MYNVIEMLKNDLELSHTFFWKPAIVKETWIKKPRLQTEGWFVIDNVKWPQNREKQNRRDATLQSRDKSEFLQWWTASSFCRSSYASRSRLHYRKFGVPLRVTWYLGMCSSPSLSATAGDMRALRNYSRTWEEDEYLCHEEEASTTLKTAINRSTAPLHCIPCRRTLSVWKRCNSISAINSTIIMKVDCR